MSTQTTNTDDNIALTLLTFQRTAAIGRGLLFITAATTAATTATTGGDGIRTNANWRIRTARMRTITIRISRVE